MKFIEKKTKMKGFALRMALLAWSVVGSVAVDVFGESRSVPMTYLYIVGVEGVGHHGVTPAVEAIAHSCGQMVVYENKWLRNAHKFKNEHLFQTTMKGFATKQRENFRDVLFIEDSSLPTGNVARHTTNATNKVVFNSYDLVWVYNTVKKVEGVKVKFLYLNRDFYRTVASHPEFDRGFEKHAKVLHDFIWYINAEYQIIDGKESDLWRQISYEWFTEMDNCTALVTAVADFVGFKTCDVSSACTLLKKYLHSKRKPVNATEQAYAQQFNVTLPIPVLDISPDRQPRVRDVVSAAPSADMVNLHVQKKVPREVISTEQANPAKAVPDIVKRPPPHPPHVPIRGHSLAARENSLSRGAIA